MSDAPHASFRSPLQESTAVRWLLIAIAVAFLALVVLLPLAAVAEALRKGPRRRSPPSTMRPPGRR